jgi:cytidylate kinase
VKERRRTNKEPGELQTIQRRQIETYVFILSKVKSFLFACFNVKHERKEQQQEHQPHRTPTCRQNISGCEISDTASLIPVLAAAREVAAVVEYSDDEPE